MRHPGSPTDRLGGGASNADLDTSHHLSSTFHRIDALNVAEIVARAMTFDPELELGRLSPSDAPQETTPTDSTPRAGSPLAYGNAAVSLAKSNEQGVTTGDKSKVQLPDNEQWDQFLRSTAPPAIPTADEIDTRFHAILNAADEQRRFLDASKARFNQPAAEVPDNPLAKVVRFEKIRKNREALLALYETRAQDDMAFEWGVAQPGFRDKDTGIVNIAQKIGFGQTLIRHLHERLQGFNVGLTAVALTFAGSATPEKGFTEGTRYTAFEAALDPKRRLTVETLLKGKHSELQELYRVLYRVPHKHVEMPHGLNQHVSEAVKAGIAAMIFMRYAGDPEVFEAMRTPEA